VTPPAWSDVAADLEAARAQAGRAVAKEAALGGLGGEAREDRELAIGKHLHDAVSALERALERLILDLDGDLPRGPRFHQDLLDRAARAMPGLRPPLLGDATRRDLARLMAFRHAFRHAYGTYDHALARPNVALAAEAIPRALTEIESAARRLGLA
jgi:hypothetical protein